MGVLSFKKETLDRGLTASGSTVPLFNATDDAIVELRAVTLALIDKVHAKINYRLGGNVALSKAQLVQGGILRAAQIVALRMRPFTTSGPIILA